MEPRPVPPLLEYSSTHGQCDRVRYSSTRSRIRVQWINQTPRIAPSLYAVASSRLTTIARPSPPHETYQNLHVLFIKHSKSRPGARRYRSSRKRTVSHSFQVTQAANIRRHESRRVHGEARQDFRHVSKQIQPRYKQQSSRFRRRHRLEAFEAASEPLHLGFDLRRLLDESC